ncbi:MAG: hypothetical protein GTO24_15630 [candidate division Zixibacteria bacterium]|nr:hypothetical protein [candidate division Zixibacteria bacterium]
MSKSEQKVSKKMLQLEESVSTEIQKIAAVEVREYWGLCSTCKEAPTCTYRKDLWQPVWQCDEFECESIQVRTFPPIDSPFKSNAAYEGSDKYKGLCLNCENRETCTYPKPEGGVWHCDEYK